MKTRNERALTQQNYELYKLFVHKQNLISALIFTKLVIANQKLVLVND